MAPKKPGLRVVTEDEAAEPRKTLTLIEAIELGDQYQILLAQRRDIAKSLPDEKGPAKAALHRQLMIVTEKIAAMEAKLEQEAGGDGLIGDQPWNQAAI